MDSGSRHRILLGAGQHAPQSAMIYYWHMNPSQKLSLFWLRIVLGWMFFWAGITKVLDPTWSAAGYLGGAKVLGGFYHWLTGPGILPTVNFMNEWGLTLLGVSLILG